MPICSIGTMSEHRRKLSQRSRLAAHYPHGAGQLSSRRLRLKVTGGDRPALTTVCARTARARDEFARFQVSVLPEILEPIRCHFGIPHRVLDILMAHRSPWQMVAERSFKSSGPPRAPRWPLA